MGGAGPGAEPAADTIMQFPERCHGSTWPANEATGQRGRQSRRQAATSLRHREFVQHVAHLRYGGQEVPKTTVKEKVNAKEKTNANVKEKTNP